MEGVQIYDPRNDSMVQRYKYIDDEVLLNDRDGGFTKFELLYPHQKNLYYFWI